MLIVYEPKTNQELSVVKHWLQKRNYINYHTITVTYEICVEVEHQAYLWIPKKYDGVYQFIRPRNLSGFVNQVQTLESKLGITK